MKKFLFTILACLANAFLSYGQDGFVAGNPELAYWQVGKEKETVIVLHGGPAAQHAYLRPEFDALSKVAKVIYYDQRGCGKSAKADTYIWQEHVKDLKRVIKILGQDKKVYLAGSSWGSTLAMIYAYIHPEDVKGLILSGTYRWEGEAMTPYAYSIYQRDILPSRLVSNKIRLREQKLVQYKAKNGQLIDTLISINKEAEIYTGYPQTETRKSFVTAPLSDSLKKIMLPVLLFNGTEHCEIEDWGEQYAKLLPQAELYTIIGACHDPWFSNPENFFNQCKVFIKRITNSN
ncbi:alpha/beta fold hydrolase [Fibrella forsythiae]|uniref:Alpha/beta hydrolase n=1 Tax=Fibrella forsythiae TaxID=2817061 RepID=A0ABS3JUP0_9BACT|nr:alpha/beta hydrolase [Fibrella forsythiae]MBO0953101.1 alpha/beta hydrolase [Fibrella forsythiae]